MAGLARIFARFPSDGAEAAERFVALAQEHGYDITALFGVKDVSGEVRHAALGIPGPGRTAMLYVSTNSGRPERDPERANLERAGCIAAACRHLATLRESDRASVCIAQTLLEPSEQATRRAFESAGFLHVGRLRYIHQPIARPSGASLRWPVGISVDPVGGVEVAGKARDDLLLAMKRSYEGTLDCPRLCGMRTTEDILASHLATGQWDPTLWWIVRGQGEPHGCMLLSRCPEQDTVELVYLGISPELRGRGLASMLLRLGRSLLDECDGATWSCAVDEANTPALKLYERHGFVPYARREALVKGLSNPGD
jgi:ribosomal protein S18 acetylase RimI-like enzyme